MKKEEINQFKINAIHLGPESCSEQLNKSLPRSQGKNLPNKDSQKSPNQRSGGSTMLFGRMDSANN
jgi:hypothetical protein